MGRNEIGVKIDPDGEFRKALAAASRECEDLTIPLTEITREWFQGNRAIYRLKTPGKYADLSANYKKQKQRRHGFVYPILRASGKLERSIIDPKDAKAIANIVNKKTLYLGSKVKYAEYLQTGTSRMPSRPYVLIGAEQSGPPEFNRRFEIFGNIFKEYVRQVAMQRIGG